MLLTTDEAERIIAGCVAAARNAGFAVGVTVADANGDSLIARRGEDKNALTLRLSMAKAYTSAVMRMPTRDLEHWQQSRPTVLSALSQLGPHPIVPGDGGVPIRRDGHVVGAVGMSGAPQQEDLLIEAVLSDLGYDIL